MLKIIDRNISLNPYESCPCGSDKKFKFCCFKKAKQFLREENTYRTFNDSRLQNLLKTNWRETDFKICFAENDDCKGNIKSAHSIQNNRILNRISEEGHVYNIEASVINSSVKPKFNKISKNKASTFFGFCDYHDTEIFKPIEQNTYENTEQQNFLLAYRAFFVAYHKVIRKMSILRNAFKKYPSSLLDPQAIIMYRTAQLDMKDDELECELLKNNFNNQNFSTIESFVYVLNYEINFAVSSYFTISKDMRNNTLHDIYNLDEDIVIPGVFINVFPVEGKTNIVISYNKYIDNNYKVLFAQLRDSTEEELLDYLSYTIFNCTEDLYFRPSSIEALNEHQKNSMIESYTSFLSPFNEMALIINGMHFEFNLFKL
ncbi:hypothetical protein [Marinilactibacillus piezotolerans]|uniref:hypothetical protein n=1 Tax=Marinilactibacillus piezotolerans TaxID=258723 RepID=UPI0009AFFFC4|nr:hypothetical protein [Marinilactibacillus piezotolerans]